MLRALKILVILWTLALPCMAELPGRARASLESDVSAMAPGKPFWVAVRIDAEPHWHTYWRNPGDAGLATKVTWDVPAGFTVGALQWPTPTAFSADGSTTYGYEGTVRLLALVTPPARLDGTSVRLRAKVEWLACQNVCVRGTASPTLSLGVSARSQPSAAASSVSAARAALPVAWTGRPLSASPEGSTLRLSFELPPGARSAVFFPTDALIVDPSAAQKFDHMGKGATLILTRGPAPSLPARLEGVLVFSTDGNKKQSFEISAPIKQ